MSNKDLAQEAIEKALDLTIRVAELEKELARLEDLRRWRPMTERPALPPRTFVLGRGYGFESVYWSEGEWYGDDGLIETGDLLRMEWTYIPGQEPKEEV